MLETLGERIGETAFSPEEEAGATHQSGAPAVSTAQNGLPESRVFAKALCDRTVNLQILLHTVLAPNKIE